MQELEHEPQIPEQLREICDEFELDYPEPGEQWEFYLEEPPEGRDIGRELTSAGCTLNLECVPKFNEDYPDHGRLYNYTVPTPGWPEPLGYVTDSPFGEGWVNSQTRWGDQSFYGNVRGTIPDGGNCDRHPELPPDSYALTAVSISGPGLEATYGANVDLERPDDSWATVLKYEQTSSTSSPLTEIYSSGLGPFPRCTKWRYAPYRRHERRWAEFFDTLEEAVQFVFDETGLVVPEMGD